MLKYPLMWFVRGWRRFVSPVYGDVCKFHPSCSAYGLRALEFHGAIKVGARSQPARNSSRESWPL